jgi:hypothetical protein
MLVVRSDIIYLQSACQHYLADCEMLDARELNATDQITLKLLNRELNVFIRNIDQQRYVDSCIVLLDKSSMLSWPITMQ